MDFIFDPSLVLYLPLYQMDGASFMSKDTYGHTCTVTGALWRPKGRYFDGTDDRISYGTSSAIDIADDLTLEAWIKPGSAHAGTIIANQFHDGEDKGWSLEVDSENDFWFRIASVNLEVTDIDYVADTWSYIVARRLGTELSVWKDTVKSGTTGTLSGSIGFEPSRPKLIGMRSIVAMPFDGLMGEVRVYNRGLSALEIHHNYLATKWRYK